MWWAAWWAWAAFGVGLVILEVVAPGYVFLGFGIGAGVTALALLAGGGLGGWLAGSLPMLLVFFAVVSLFSWIVLRRMLGVTRSQVKTFDEDINRR